ncbi:Gfo/Idh/MocA family protein [Quadrisphaera sp. KR29]|uniref:Gfo/Idh/MocA family protein n=1 Tax=Quadrisphaera sp. KR29 TaxID=3461391 RepID=UPI0040445C71
MPPAPAAPPLRVAVLGSWHVHADDYARSVLDHPGTELVAVWDDDAERGRAAAARLGAPFEPDLDALLSGGSAAGRVDGVTVTTSTAAHREVVGAAVRAGVHVFTEKLLAPTVAECTELLAEAERTGAVVVVSLPRLYAGCTAAVREVVESGRLGRVTYARVRLSHEGAVTGWLPDRFFDPGPSVGGALTDLGCHPVYLVQLLLGARPDSVIAAYGSVTGRAVEDNAVVVASYPDGVIGVAEASFSSPTPFTIDVFGTEGTVSWADTPGRLTATGAAFRPADGDDGGAPVQLPVPEDSPGAFAQWVGHIAAGTRAEENTSRAVELTRLVVAANRAAAEQRAVALD